MGYILGAVEVCPAGDSDPDKQWVIGRPSPLPFRDCSRTYQNGSRSANYRQIATVIYPTLAGRTRAACNFATTLYADQPVGMNCQTKVPGTGESDR